MELTTANMGFCLPLSMSVYTNSAFTAVTVASTLADMYAAVTAAVASLKGPLHGGANVDASLMLEEVGEAKNVERWVEEQLAKGRRIPGFGHRLYKRGPDRRTELHLEKLLAQGLDPRAAVEELRKKKRC